MPAAATHHAAIASQRGTPAVAASLWRLLEAFCKLALLCSTLPYHLTEPTKARPDRESAALPPLLLANPAAGDVGAREPSTAASHPDSLFPIHLCATLAQSCGCICNSCCRLLRVIRAVTQSPFLHA